MRICAIIAEYNPLHTGHIYHINSVKNFADIIIIVLSGHTVQRGEFSIFNKWTKTKAAILAGADIVLEMPAIFSCSSAETFAHCAIKIIKELKIVTDISFGSENGDIKKIKKLATICQKIDSTKKMKYFLKKGYNYPTARNLSIGKMADILKYPNNTLAVEYVKAALNLNFKVSFHTIKRFGALHDSLIEKTTISSKFLRNNIDDIKNYNKYIPTNILKLYDNPIKIPDFIFLNKLREISLKQLENTNGVSEGIHNRLFKACKQAVSLKEFFNLTKTKRYTLTRLKRIVLACLLEIEKQKNKNLPKYCKILGFSKKGQTLLHLFKNNNSFLITTQFKTIFENFPNSAKIDAKATDIAMLFQKKPQPCNMDFLTKPIIF